MPSKELIEKVARDICDDIGAEYDEHPSYWNNFAEIAAGTIRAALQEDRCLHEIIERHFNMPHGIGYGKDRLYAFLAASALGEQSE